MADYYPLLARAVAGLADPTPQARSAIYDRARNALLGQLRRLDPPIADEEIDRESVALEDAVARLEADFTPKPPEAASPEPPPPEFHPPQPQPERADIAAAPIEPTVAERPNEPSAPHEIAGEPSFAGTPDAPHAPEAEPQAEPQERPPAAAAETPAPAASPPGEGADDNAAQKIKDDSAKPDFRAGRPSSLQTRPPMFFKARRDKTTPEPAPGAILPPRRPLGTSLLRMPPRVPAAPVAAPAPGFTPEPPPKAEPAPEPLPDQPAHGDENGWREPVFEPREAELRRWEMEGEPRWDAPAPAPLGEAPADEWARSDFAPPAPEADAPARDEGGSDPASAAPIRPRAEAQRPFAPQPRREDAAPRRLWLVGFILGLLVFLVAIAAYQLRDRPEELRQRAAAPLIIPEPAPSGKIVDRIGGGQNQPQDSAAGSPPATSPAPSSAARGAPTAVEPETQSARRAALLVEAPEEPNKVRTFLGAVNWKVDNVTSGPNDPLSMAVHATVEIPEEKLEIVMTLQKNFDSSLPASHTMKIQFIEGADSPLGSVQQISVPQMRLEDTATGDALNGVPVQITDNTFLVGLTSGSPEAGNLDLLKSRGWIDVPILLSNGKIAKLTFEKGPAGDRAIDDAIAAWKGQ
ncbi:hypothetical protein Msil_1006 [Methylocella silvestris BL2]|uniref:Uncharacterized protein n=1 Tax=Methylocella silvestris (strain DSM 15510 / CIP 108128 / LMG 27833 / NCIMB 13906 / BL2) TaxID=395965 RepID=B8EK28_METSB|nr:hypothetical protein [Methylocella silvestris]ACK49975.1 hypothetical protein Msil_1006 [Methylocella silvestris BL2]